MRVVCVGGGPAGLYLGILLRLRGGHDVTVLERNPAGVTYGWGVVFWDDLLDALHAHDPVSARAVHAAAAAWNGQEVRVAGHRPVHLGSGAGFGVGRHRLLRALGRRAEELGVDVRHGHQVETGSELSGADLVVACDGAGSALRRRRAGRFGTEIEVGRNRYLWLGTRRRFDAFTFAFERTAAGWIWCHAYRFDEATSTCIVECPPETWTGLGLDRLPAADGVRLLTQVFAEPLDGEPLLDRDGGGEGARWLGFRRVANRRWHDGGMVLMGDAAHTTHFAIGAGTRLAIADAIGLAEALGAHRRLGDALDAYEAERRAAMAAETSSAAGSTRWFEEVPRHVEQPPVRFAYALWTRRGRVASWRYPVHLALQFAGARRALRWAARARSTLRARRRNSPNRR